MNVWMIATTVLLVGLLPCVWVALLMIAQGLRRDPFMDLALVSAILSFAGALTFVRFLERWV